MRFVLSISLIGLLSTSYAQNRDSLILYLYESGQIPPSTYFKSRPISETAAQAKKMIHQLRDSLPYKFPLDYLAEHLDSTTLSNCVLFGEIGPFQMKDKRVLEAFDLGISFGLYRYLSFDGKDRPFLLGSFSPRLGGFDLFTSDSIHTDQVSLPREGEFQFGTLNGGNVIKLLFPSSGTGAFEKYMKILAIKENHFYVLYEATLAAQATFPWSTFPVRSITQVNFIDLNHDGYLDIVETTTVDSVADLADDPSKDGEIEKIPSLKTLNRQSRNLLWNHDLSTFLEEKIKKP